MPNYPSGRQKSTALDVTIIREFYKTLLLLQQQDDGQNDTLVLWEAYKGQLSEDKKIQANQLESFIFNKLPARASQQDILFANFRVQLIAIAEIYEKSNQFNGRFFEVAEIKIGESNILVLLAPQYSGRATSFHKKIKKQPENKAWQALGKLSPYRKDNAGQYEVYSQNLYENLAVFLSQLTIQVQKDFLDWVRSDKNLLPYIDQLGIPYDKLFISILNIYSHVFFPTQSVNMKGQRALQYILTSVESNFFTTSVEIKTSLENTVNSLCNSIQEKISTLITGDSDNKECIFQNNRENIQEAIIQLAELDEINITEDELENLLPPEQAKIDKRSFQEVENKTADQVLVHLLSTNPLFDVIPKRENAQELQLGAARRIFRNFITDERCPQAIKNKTNNESFFNEAMWCAAKSNNNKILRIAVDLAIEEKLKAPVKESMPCENKQYKNQLFDALDNNEDLPKYFTHLRIQKYLLRQMEALEKKGKIGGAESMRAILNSLLPLVDKLKMLACIGQGKSNSSAHSLSRVGRRYEVSQFYKDLQVFTTLKLHRNIGVTFEKFMRKNKKVDSSIKNIEKHIQHVALLTKSKAPKDTDYSTLFKRWFNYSVKIWQVPNIDHLTAISILPKEEEIKKCCDYINCHGNICHGNICHGNISKEIEMIFIQALANVALAANQSKKKKLIGALVTEIKAGSKTAQQVLSKVFHYVVKKNDRQLLENLAGMLPINNAVLSEDKVSIFDDVVFQQFFIKKINELRRIVPGTVHLGGMPVPAVLGYAPKISSAKSMELILSSDLPISSQWQLLGIIGEEKINQEESSTIKKLSAETKKFYQSLIDINLNKKNIFSVFYNLEKNQKKLKETDIDAAFFCFSESFNHINIELLRKFLHLLNEKIKSNNYSFALIERYIDNVFEYINKAYGENNNGKKDAFKAEFLLSLFKILNAANAESTMKSIYNIFKNKLQVEADNSNQDIMIVYLNEIDFCKNQINAWKISIFGKKNIHYHLYNYYKKIINFEQNIYKKASHAVEFFIRENQPISLDYIDIPLQIDHVAQGKEILENFLFHSEFSDIFKSLSLSAKDNLTRELIEKNSATGDIKESLLRISTLIAINSKIKNSFLEDIYNLVVMRDENTMISKEGTGTYGFLQALCTNTFGDSAWEDYDKEICEEGRLKVNALAPKTSQEAALAKMYNFFYKKQKYKIIVNKLNQVGKLIKANYQRDVPALQEGDDWRMGMHTMAIISSPKQIEHFCKDSFLSQEERLLILKCAEILKIENSPSAESNSFPNSISNERNGCVADNSDNSSEQTSSKLDAIFVALGELKTYHGLGIFPQPPKGVAEILRLQHQEHAVMSDIDKLAKIKDIVEHRLTTQVYYRDSKTKAVYAKLQDFFAATTVSSSVTSASLVSPLSMLAQDLQAIISFPASQKMTMGQ